MDAHPQFADTPFPVRTFLAGFDLAILSPLDADEDFAAIDESRPVLDGLFGDNWPKGVTYESNLADLARHEREFEARFAFSWTIRSSDEAYLGCAYFRPTHGITGVGRAAYWIREGPDRVDLLKAFGPAFRKWLGQFLPDEFEVKWFCNDWDVRRIS